MTRQNLLNIFLNVKMIYILYQKHQKKLCSFTGQRHDQDLSTHVKIHMILV